MIAGVELLLSVAMLIQIVPAFLNYLWMYSRVYKICTKSAPVISIAVTCLYGTIPSLLCSHIAFAKIETLDESALENYINLATLWVTSWNCYMQLYVAEGYSNKDP